MTKADDQGAGGLPDSAADHAIGALSGIAIRGKKVTVRPRPLVTQTSGATRPASTRGSSSHAAL